MASIRGAWHIVSVLSQLVSLFSNDGERHTLRAGQFEWIQGQLLRTMRLLGLGRQVDKLESSEDPRPTDSNREAAVSEKATDHARKIRDGLRLMSGS